MGDGVLSIASVSGGAEQPANNIAPTAQAAERQEERSPLEFSAAMAVPSRRSDDGRRTYFLRSGRRPKSARRATASSWRLNRWRILLLRRDRQLEREARAFARRA